MLRVGGKADRAWEETSVTIEMNVRACRACGLRLVGALERRDGS
jgi:hypothetical protein